MQSADFYATLAIELIQLVKKSFKGKKLFYNSSKILPKLIEIFEVFVIFECPFKDE